MTKKQRKRYGKLLGVILLMGLLKMLSGCSAHKTEMDAYETGARHNNTDWSAPKVIESQDITKFCCDYSAAGAIDGLQSERYEAARFSMIRTETGVECELWESFYEGDPVHVCFEAGFDALRELQKILLEADVASCNGINVRVDGLPPELEGSILVEYASGERIYAYDNSEMPYPCEIIEPLCALFERLADEAGILS